MSVPRPTTLPALPCYPCPHQGSCCAYGTTVRDDEVAAIEAAHGAGFVYRTRWGEWRTRVRNKRCVFFKDGGCSIHDRSYYPVQCRAFPWTDPDTGGRYEHDLMICGEFGIRPQLVTLQRALPTADDLSK
ncbi:MAG TPA: YkgJ family cysteine cluster protein [Gemmatimonadaceae bacterium]|nr:YkgJ family cysteine cluster protein [Gemmatimonadaceae bacterium]